MTGKELIIYILDNDLLDEDVVQDGVPIFLMDVSEAASEFDVGPMTIRVWEADGQIDSAIIDDRLYIYRNTKDPRK